MFVIGNEFELEIISITKEEYDFLKATGEGEATLTEDFSLNEQIPLNINGNAFGYWSSENSLKFQFTVN